ncbi:MAG: hypothetical protein GF311_10545 [Candidatus Lokiarchaeota archaeon]|nr:hypothetical protein [Candidatus Lokiarchaeota archaeon]
MDDEVKDQITLTSLKQKTEEYWDERWNLDTYIRELFKFEFDYLTSNQAINSNEIKCEVLVLLIGYSWEPLFISICGHLPNILVPVINENYGDIQGSAYRENLMEYLDILKDIELLKDVPRFHPDPVELITSDNPKGVFTFLKNSVLPLMNQYDDVIIDITGAKKTMVSGAYLFAAYTNTPISYVDFNDYNIKYGKPYGYSCFIEHFENPMEKFRLNDWTLIRSYYQNYSFDLAKNIVKNILFHVKNFFNENEIENLENFVNVLNYYKLWDEGKFKEANLLYNNKDLRIPNLSAIDKLGNSWFDEKDFKNSLETVESIANLEKSIYNEDERLLIYTFNEFAKSKKLYNQENYKSALQRAIGLFELLIKSRIIRMWLKNQYVLDSEGISQSRKQFNNVNKWDFEMGRISALKYMIYSLTWERSGDKTLYIKKYQGHRKEKAPKLDKFWRYDNEIREIKTRYNLKTYPHDFLCLFRNKSLHFCLNIPKNIAKLSHELLMQNIRDFILNWARGNWAKDGNWGADKDLNKFIENLINDYNLNVKPLKWGELIRILNLAFLPNRDDR